MLKNRKEEKNSPRAQMTLLASFGPVFIVLPSLASSSIDHIAYCCRLWWFAGIGCCLMVEGEERG